MADLIEELREARKQHISDLRVLLDKSADRETKLQSMLEVVIQERHFQPAVTGAAGENRVESPIDPETLNDVAVFDEKEDAMQMADAEKELQSLIDEQLTQGITKPEEVTP